MQIAAPVTQLPEDTLFRHTKRPSWGLALSVERTDSVWRLQFEDGKLRKLGVRFLHLCDPVTLPPDENALVVETLSAAAGIQVAREDAAAHGRDLITLGQQIAIFRQLYPEGFAGEWQKKIRGEGRRIKRHREPAITEARELLGERSLTALNADGYYAEVIARMQTVLTNTSLVSQKQLEPLSWLKVHHQGAVASALGAVLHGTGRFDTRMHAFLAAFKPVGGASWPLATSLLGLVHPERHVAVALSTMRKEARWMLPNLSIPNQPTAAIYLRLVSMVKGIAASLREQGLAPRDLLDVTDFMRETLRPAAAKLVTELPREQHVRATLKAVKALQSERREQQQEPELAPVSGVQHTDVEEQAA